MEDLIDFNDYGDFHEELPNNYSDKGIKQVVTPMDDYQLDNFYRNAMLLFCNSDTRTGEIIAETFQKYRFIVDKYEDLPSFEIEEKCHSFFSRNFSEYGAVAVVVIEPQVPEVNQETFDDESNVCDSTHTPTGPEMLRAADRSYHESVILKHFTTDVPNTLSGKPKIYITKTSCITERMDIHNYDDILALHLPFDARYYRDILISELCNNIEESGEDEDFLEIIKETIYQTRQDNQEKDTLQKIDTIYDFLGEEYVHSLVKPFLSMPSHSYTNKQSKCDLTETPKLTCTFTKRMFLPSDIYFNQTNLQTNVSYTYRDFTPQI